MTPMNAILTFQVLSFVALGCLFIHAGNWKLGTAQLLLAVIQGLIYA